MWWPRIIFIPIGLLNFDPLILFFIIIGFPGLVIILWGLMRYYLPGFPQQDEEVQTSGKEVKKHIFRQTLFYIKQKPSNSKLYKLYQGIQF